MPANGWDEATVAVIVAVLMEAVRALAVMVVAMGMALPAVMTIAVVMVMAIMAAVVMATEMRAAEVRVAMMEAAGAHTTPHLLKASSTALVAREGYAQTLNACTFCKPHICCRSTLLAHERAHAPVTIAAFLCVEPRAAPQLY